ncbi:unnamed protein product [Schistosoma curassoni]|uniref:Glycerol-3-phosphate acyltransferase n=1 Tax=Schistosoma curassoni TaxID=6186 RepID=A0A183K3A9_9TREM|nr:unnamed protein product [Schistosoma curassoni]
MLQKLADKKYTLVLSSNMLVRGSRQDTLNPGFVLLGTHQQGVPVILRELVLPGGFDLVSPSFIVRGVTTELPEPRQLYD